METRSKTNIGNRGDEEEKEQRQTKILDMLLEKLERMEKRMEKMEKKMEENGERILERMERKIDEKFETMEKKMERKMEERLERMEDNSKDIFEKLSNIYQFLDTRINDNKEELGRQIESIEDKIQEKLYITQHKIKSMQDNLDSNLKEVNEKINKQKLDLENKMSRDGMPTVLNLGENKWNFDGRIKRQHPIPFIKYLENKEAIFQNFIVFKEFIRSTLSEEALLWFNNKEMEIDTFLDFKRKFLEYFWGSAQQKVIKNELFSGKFNEVKGTSYHRYAMQLYSVAQYLDAKFSEEYIVSLIIQHFENLQDVLLLYDFKSIDKLCQFLISQENKLRRNYQKRNFTNNSNDLENNGGHGYWQRNQNGQNPTNARYENRNNMNYNQNRYNQDNRGQQYSRQRQFDRNGTQNTRRSEEENRRINQINCSSDIQENPGRLADQNF